MQHSSNSLKSNLMETFSAFEQHNQDSNPGRVAVKSLILIPGLYLVCIVSGRPGMIVYTVYLIKSSTLFRHTYSTAVILIQQLAL